MKPISRAALVAAVTFASGTDPACAQTAAPPPPTAKLPPVVVTANPLGSDLIDTVPPVSVLVGEALDRQRQTTLGETLANLPGVTSSYYGPNASRPIIRGLDGDRIRILQNGIGGLDASGTSVDHAVSIDTMTIKRVEVVRGPATLLYGSSALGGVVNVIDGRIPDERVDGASGDVVMRYASPATERSFSAGVDSGNASGFALHGDTFKTLTDDLRIPGFARSARLRAQDPLPPDEEEAQGRLPNSASDSDGGAVGASYVGQRGYLGASWNEFRSNYGTVAEEGVTIGMQQKQFNVAGRLDDVGDWLSNVKIHYGHSNYQHTEFDGGVAGTNFRNRGFEARLDAVHRKIGAFEGAFGMQTVDFDFSALGEEGFLPRTHTRSVAGFLFEQLKAKPFTWQLGGRIERTSVAADEDENFGLADKRTFTTGSASLAAVYAFDGAHSIAASVVATERPPNYQELYADGPHLATGNFVIGDRGLETERSTGFDIALRRTAGALTGRIGAYYNRFRNFITQFPTGETDPEFDVPIFVYRQTRATFKGLELEGRLEAGSVGGGALAFEARADWLRATDDDSGQPLPRIAPLRFGGAVVWARGPIGTRLDVLRVQQQDRVADNELPTDGYTMVDATLAYDFGLSRGALRAFVKGTNLLNAEARNHASFLKDIAPMGSRGITVGIHGTF